MERRSEVEELEDEIERVTSNSRIARALWNSLVVEEEDLVSGGDHHDHDVNMQEEIASSSTRRGPSSLQRYSHLLQPPRMPYRWTHRLFTTDHLHQVVNQNNTNDDKDNEEEEEEEEEEDSHQSSDMLQQQHQYPYADDDITRETDSDNHNEEEVEVEEEEVEEEEEEVDGEFEDGDGEEEYYFEEEEEEEEEGGEGISYFEDLERYVINMGEDQEDQYDEDDYYDEEEEDDYDEDEDNITINGEDDDEDDYDDDGYDDEDEDQDNDNDDYLLEERIMFCDLEDPASAVSSSPVFRGSSSSSSSSTSLSSSSLSSLTNVGGINFNSSSNSSNISNNSINILRQFTSLSLNLNTNHPMQLLDILEHYYRNNDTPIFKTYQDIILPMVSSFYQRISNEDLLIINRHLKVLIDKDQYFAQIVPLLDKKTQYLKIFNQRLTSIRNLCGSNNNSHYFL
ncbi:transitin [Heterostelium album PN500]|uniref:Transitin n=1 Tax=Heterostelium pallidum (strain ATCC 26659 / Pp 5 / PN500) TaxID=670386 RepID=D3BI22_HETP5|nr:transitin [Heterostelium album PN500]EFA78922.1 transitin [Heterostelium album PN500]|eukprot:XP_020431046.1 transitin [Heterostelium album PN500]